MPEETTISYHVIVTGRVQGVGFRYSARKAAAACGVSGWVRNRPDGSVELVCEGNRQRVTRLLKWLQSGPPGSHVTGIEKNRIKPQGAHRSFTIRF